MTPAIKLLSKTACWYKVHQYEHDDSVSSYGEEASQKLGIESSKVFKTLVVQFEDHSLAVAVIPVSSMLSMKAIAKALGKKKANLAAANDVERTTGYVLGGVSPLAQKKRLKTAIDVSAKDCETIFMSGGKRGLEIELRPDDLMTLLNAKFATLTT